MRTSSLLAPLALVLGLAGTTLAQTLEPTNLGPMRVNEFTGHVLTPPPAPGERGALDRILYCPSEADDTAFRAAISLAAGGATVDYFDARAATPALSLLDTYDAIYTWANYAYFDNVAMGDVLAQANDNGKDIVLGVFCTYTTGNFLSGAIMTPAYCPVVSPTGTNHFSASPYLLDGTTCIYNGVAALDSDYRDVLVLQGTGVKDGTYTDGELVHAFRPDTLSGKGNVIYQNGCGASALGGTGNWDVAVANASLCTPGVSVGTCTFRAGVLGTNPLGFDCVNMPFGGATWKASVDLTPTHGVSVVETIVLLSTARPISGLPWLGCEMLLSPPIGRHTALGVHDIPIPAQLAGATIYTQGVRIELDPSGVPICVLLNAQDLVVG